MIYIIRVLRYSVGEKNADKEIFKITDCVIGVSKV